MMTRTFQSLLLALSLVVIAPSHSNAQASPPVHVGQASAIDGDTIRIGSETIRLWGIDAPESNQMCGENACGEIATQLLASLIESPLVTVCNERDRDRYGRAVAVCRVRGLDLSAAMVFTGHAIAFRRYSMDYVAEETMARETNRGAWEHGLTDPSQFRAERRTSAQPEPQPVASAGPVSASPVSGRCVVRGNINRSGERIYHTASSPAYNRVVPEACFDTEAQARAAGFCAPRG